MARLIGFLACTQRRNEKNENISKKSPARRNERERDSPEKKGGPRRIAWRGGDGDGARGTGHGARGWGRDWLEKFCRHLANESIEIERHQWR